jgi:hypothetical protein
MSLLVGVRQMTLEKKTARFLVPISHTQQNHTYCREQEEDSVKDRHQREELSHTLESASIHFSRHALVLELLSSFLRITLR